MKKYYLSKQYDSPIGRLFAVSSDKGLSEILVNPQTPPNYERGDPFSVVWQLEKYFGGRLSRFDVPFDIDVSEFTKKVLEKTCEIPYGKTSSYGKIAGGLGKPNASRAVGGALGRNPVPVIIPCHRVVSKNSLRGFALGLDIKRKLLMLEGADIDF